MSNEVVAAHIWDHRGVLRATACVGSDGHHLCREIIDEVARRMSVRVASQSVGNGAVVSEEVEGHAVECVLVPLGNPEGLPDGTLSITIDLTERARIETTLYQRLAFERLITELSTEFISLSPIEIDPGIEHALHAVGEFAHVDRAYVFLYSDDRTTMINTHEWCAPGVEPQIQNLTALPVEVFPWWTERMRAREVIQVSHVIDLPEQAAAERQILIDQSIQSIVVVPMVCGSDVIGFVGFDWVRTSKDWAPDDVALLRIVGEIVANAMNRRRAEQERAQLEAQLVQTRSLENVAKLAGGVAHDFNNLLGVVLNYASILRKELTESHHIAYLDELQDSAKQAAELTRQLLLAGRRGIIEPIALDVNEVVVSLRGLLERTLGEQVQMKLELAEDIGIVRLGVPHLEQIILNLTMNARDAMPRGGQFTIETATTNLTAQDVARYLDLTPGRYTVLSVSDTGSGMTPEVASRACDPFFTTKGRLGTGLGLSTVAGIVKQAEGHLAIDTAPGAGCTIRIYLPIVGDAQAQPKPSAPSDGPAPEGLGETVLVVEDSLAVRKLVCNALSSHGYRVLGAGCPSEALCRAEEAGPFDLLLTDVILPEMSGRALAERMRNMGKVTRVLYMSGYEDDVIAQHGVLAEGVRLLQKPFVEPDLLRYVRLAIEEG